LTTPDKDFRDWVAQLLNTSRVAKIGIHHNGTAVDEIHINLEDGTTIMFEASVVRNFFFPKAALKIKVFRSFAELLSCERKLKSSNSWGGDPK